MQAQEVKFANALQFFCYSSCKSLSHIEYKVAPSNVQKAAQNQ